MRKVLFLLVIFALAVAAPVYAANVSGTWALTQAGPQGDENFDLVIKDSGGSLSITGTHPMLGEMEGTGTLKGNDITMDIKATGQMPIDFKYTGKVTGKKMEGTKEYSMAGGGEGGAPAGGGQGGAPAGGGQGAPPSGGQGGAPAGGGEGGAPPAGGGQGGGAPGGGGGGGEVSNVWSAVMK